ncbi:hypothetical protein [Methanobrevibacter oralis]|uniref:hypothetical protein n=1 Tax=Methanobrevibacter oralis TaxID=66851 RepID=UPI001FD3A2B8|nr:hypothetical protein [Methanobrevibacter oralis]
MVSVKLVESEEDHLSILKRITKKSKENINKNRLKIFRQKDQLTDEEKEILTDLKPDIYKIIGCENTQ